MYIAQRGVPRRSAMWVSLKTLSAACLVVSIAAAVGSIADVIDALKIIVTCIEATAQFTYVSYSSIVMVLLS
ncbi:hypothetical protein ABZP36_012304 [Zizania latifolia]